jgi:hypothetical protein
VHGCGDEYVNQVRLKSHRVALIVWGTFSLTILTGLGVGVIVSFVTRSILWGAVATLLAGCGATLVGLAIAGSSGIMSLFKVLRARRASADQDGPSVRDASARSQKPDGC